MGILIINSFTNKFFIEFTDGFISLIGELNTLGGPIRNPPNCKILENWAFENVILADEPFIKALQIFETGVSNWWNWCLKLETIQCENT